MRKLNKTCDLSTVYKDWEEELENTNQPHPKYSSSSFRFYKDVVMQLFRCQNGLCAYTEKRLCPPELIEANQWTGGRFTGNLPNKGKFGQLEHFDESLKAKSITALKQDWLWSNFFMVHSDINNRKGTKSVDYILKPDSEDYNPFELLDYDFDDHHFYPNLELETALQMRVLEMIDTLGINDVAPFRKKFLSEQFYYFFTGQELDDSPSEYPTAYEFALRKLENGEIEIENVV